MGVLLSCVLVLCVGAWCLRRPEEGNASPWTGDAEGCSHHMDTGNQAQVLWKSKCSWALRHLSAPGTQNLFYRQVSSPRRGKHWLAAGCKTLLRFCFLGLSWMKFLPTSNTDIMPKIPPSWWTMTSKTRFQDWMTWTLLSAGSIILELSDRGALLQPHGKSTWVKRNWSPSLNQHSFTHLGDELPGKWILSAQTFRWFSPSLCLRENLSNFPHPVS